MKAREVSAKNEGGSIERGLNIWAIRYDIFLKNGERKIAEFDMVGGVVEEELPKARNLAGKGFRKCLVDNGLNEEDVVEPSPEAVDFGNYKGLKVSVVDL